MIQIINSPTYSKTYPQPNEDLITFDYNVVGVLSNVNYTFKSLQAIPLSITREGAYLLLSLKTNIKNYLDQVVATTRKEAQVYFEDTQNGIYNYSGAYRVYTVYNVGGLTQLVLKNLTNDSPTYYQDKIYPDDNSSQLVYQYRNTFTFNVFDVTTINGVQKQIPLTQVRQQLSSTGYSVFNISEIAKGYTNTTGGVAVQIEVTEKDYFGNTSTITTKPCLFVRSRLPEINYGLYTLFNPENGGVILPTTGYKLLYDTNKVFSYYVNFVCNEMVSEWGISIKLRVRLYRDISLVSTEYITIPAMPGLNTIDISVYQNLINAITTRKPTSLKVSAVYQGVNLGEFDNQFTEQFKVTTSGSTFYSQEYYVEAQNYTLNNRRDFYFSYQNGIGGLSTFLCVEYKRVTEPEIVALRNAETISNSVARETESATLIFRYADLQGLKFLLGYDVSKIQKNDGIFESLNVTRIGSEGDTMQWIIKGASYEMANSDLYKDLTFTIYRPLSSGFDTVTL